MEPEQRGPGCGLLFVFALATYVGLLILAASLSTRSGAYLSGAMLGPVVLSTIIVGLVVRFSGRAWPEWLVAVAIAGFAVILAAGSLVSLYALEPEAEPDGTADHRLVVPTTLLGWEQAEDADQLQQVVDDLAEQFPGGEALGTVYESPDGPIVYFGINIEDGSGLQEEVQESPSDALKDALDAMGVSGVTLSDAGVLGGALGCGTWTLPTGATTFTCGWIDQGTFGTVTFPEGSTSPMRAPLDALAAREAVTVVDGS